VSVLTVAETTDGIVHRHFFGRLEIIPPLLSGRLLVWKSMKLLRPDAFPRRGYERKGRGKGREMVIPVLFPRFKPWTVVTCVSLNE